MPYTRPVRDYPPKITADPTDDVWGALVADYGRRVQVPAEYVVFYDSGSSEYVAEHCFGTGTDYHGSVGQTVINNAIGGLTAGRDHMESVLLKGEIVTTGSIELDSYTRLVIQGELKANATAFDMITFSSTSQYLVEICGGGIINGDDKADDGIHLQGPTQPSWRSLIHDLTIHNCQQNGIWTETGARIIGSNMYIYLCGQDGMHIDSYDCKFQNIVVGEAGIYGIHNDSTNNHFTGCKSYGATQNNFYCNGARAGYANCIAQEANGHGFVIGQTDQTFSGCIADRNSRTVPGVNHGFYIVGDHITLTGCAAVDFGDDSQEDGIHITSTASDIRISGFVASDQQGMNIYVHPSASGISIEGIDGDYQTQTGEWANPSTTKVSAFNGRKVLVYNSTQAGYRLYAYMNGGWRYETLT